MAKGIPNLGATCGINSLLQAIAHTPALRALLLGHTSGAGTLATRVREVIATISEGGAGDDILRLAAAMHGLVCDLYGKAGLCLGEQQDVAELWTYLADRLAEEMHDVGAAQEYRTDIPGLRDLCAVANREYGVFNKKSASGWLRLVQGFYIQQVHCCAPGCGYVTHGFQPATYISIPAITSVPEGLVDYFRFEDLHESWRCDRCGQQEQAQRVTRMWHEPPRVLVVGIKRFRFLDNGTARKIHNPCTIPTRIEMGGSLVVHTSEQGAAHPQKHTFSLTAVVQHFGSMSGGHYTCLAARSVGNDSSWLHIDDATITEIRDPNTILQNNQDGYLLFYQCHSYT